MPVASTRPPVTRASRRWVLAGAILLVVLVVALARVVVVGCGDTAALKAAPKLAPAATFARDLPDLPEPTPPEIECAFEPLVFCMPGHATAGCPATQGALVDSVYPTEAQLSPAATRARRAADPTACCYVQYRAVACD